MSTPYGTTLPVSAVFRDDDGTLTDPTTVEIEVTAPNGATTTYSHPATIDRASVGVYLATVVLDQAGTWHQRWIATGTVEVVFTSFTVVDPEPGTAGPDVYTSVERVIARAGALLDSLDDTSVPTVDAVRDFIVETAGEIHTYLAARGLTVPVTDDDARRMLAGLNGDGAMIRALEARYATASGTIDSEPLGILTSARARWDAAITAFLAGTHPLFGLLTGPSDTTAGTAASSLWTTEPAYTPEVDLTNNLGSEVYKGMTL